MDTSIYRWMEDRLVEWIYIAGGQRRIYEETLLRRPVDVTGGNDGAA